MLRGDFDTYLKTTLVIFHIFAFVDESHEKEYAPYIDTHL